MKFRREFKVGVFAAIVVAIMIFATVKVGDQSVVSGGAYELYATFSNASGLYPKASVEIAGVDVGLVKSVGLTPDGKAIVLVGIREGVSLPENSQAFLRSRGFLGEAYIEIIPGDAGLPPLKSGQFIAQTESGGDLSDMVDQFNLIATDVKEITKTLRRWTDEKEGGVVSETVHHLHDFAKVMRDVTTKNEENMNQIVRNMADWTREMRLLMNNSRYDAEQAVDRIASISKKIDEGRGTLGRLVNDSETADKVNESLDSLNEALGGYKRMELGLGFHAEFLNPSNDFKNYVSVSLKPTPDQAILLDFVSDPNPDTTRETRISDVTVGGVTTRVTTENEILKRDKVLFSAQFAKYFYDLRLRGGMIESKGGLGADYQLGALGLHFDAFDLEKRFNEKPHLKGMGTLNLTRNIYVLGGVDDPLNPAQRTDFFVGAGYHIIDDDIKSLLGFASLGNNARK